MPGFSAKVLAAEVYPALFADLAEHPERVTRFFPLAPADPEAWHRRAEDVDGLWRGEEAAGRRRELADALAAYHEPLGLYPRQREMLAALAEPDALVVVTGQQAGLLGGPLYTLYKALGAVVRAAEAERALGRPVIPVFWIASEDHDWSEISRADLVDADGMPVHLRLSGHGDFRSAGDIPLPIPEARRLVGELTTLHPPSEAGGAIAEALLEGLRRPGRLTLAGWFAWQLQRLLGAQGLLLFDPMQPRLRALAAPIFAGAAARAAATNAAVTAAGEALRAAGYAPGLHLDPEHVHLFSYVGGRRVALHARDGRIQTKDGQVDWSPEELAARAQAEPTGFSPNVALRPVVQDATLPVLCQLGGPGEVAYLAQLGEVFGLWDRPAPMVCPRPGATLLMAAERDALDRAGLRAEDLRADLQEALDRAVAARAPLDVPALFAEERAAVNGVYARLREQLLPAIPTLEALVRGNAERVEGQLAYLERKAHQHLRRSEHRLTAGLRAAAGRLFPGGGLQERHSITYPYLLAEGPSFVDEVRTALATAPGTFGQHWLLTREP